MNVGQVTARSYYPAHDLTGGPPPSSATDECEDGRTVGHAVLYRKEAQDTDAVNIQDVTQGHLDDCFLMATLGAIARSPRGADFIRHAIVENRAADGTVVSYTVTLHALERFGGNDGPLIFVQHKVTVGGALDFGCVHAQARLDAQTGENEIWPLIYENAYLQATGGAAVVVHSGGGSVSDAMQAVTGRTVDTLDPRSPKLAGTIESAIKTGALVVVSTGRNAHPLISGHAYAVTRTELGPDGEVLLHLHNPHNSGNDPPPMTWDQLKSLAAAVDIGRLP